MTPTEIITADMEKHGNDPVPFLKALNIALQKKAVILMQENNSVLMLTRIGQGMVELHLFTVDSPIKVAKSLIQFIKKIRASDIKVVYGADEPTQTLQLLKNLDVNIMPSDNPKYKWMATV
jgi:hypothetical protein